MCIHLLHAGYTQCALEEVVSMPTLSYTAHVAACPCMSSYFGFFSERPQLKLYSRLACTLKLKKKHRGMSLHCFKLQITFLLLKLLCYFAYSSD